MKITFSIKKLIALLVCILLSANLLCAAAFAAESPADENENVEWYLSDDMLTLSNNKMTYYKYEINNDSSYSIDPFSVYEYYRSVEWKTGGSTESLTVYSNAKDGDIVWLENYEGIVRAVYVTEAGRKSIDEFMSGKYARYRLFDKSFNCAILSEQLFNSLDASYPNSYQKVSIDVSVLKDLEKFEICAHDKTDAFVYTFGMIYKSDSTLYYVEYKDLPNNYFDADGSFSYRSGNVDAVVLGEDIKTQILGVMDDIAPPDYIYDYEESAFLDDILAVILVVCIALVGVAAPIALGILGMCMARSKKAGYPKHWYILSITSLIWLLAVIAIIIILITV